MDEAVPALLATASRSDDLFERSAERWVERYDSTAAIGGDALGRLLELRGMDYARAAVVRWIERLP